MHKEENGTKKRMEQRREWNNGTKKRMEQRREWNKEENGTKKRMRKQIATDRLGGGVTPQAAVCGVASPPPAGDFVSLVNREC